MPVGESRAQYKPLRIPSHASVLIFVLFGAIPFFKYPPRSQTKPGKCFLSDSVRITGPTDPPPLWLSDFHLSSSTKHGHSLYHLAHLVVIDWTWLKNSTGGHLSPHTSYRGPGNAGLLGGARKASVPSASSYSVLSWYLYGHRRATAAVSPL